MPQRKGTGTSLFDGLGRPTKRGIRNCPKCGTVNGTRGNSCKNRACDVVFRDNGASKKSTTEACKVVTNISGYQIFSVRLRDRGPDYRSFVQAPVDQTATPATTHVTLKEVESAGESSTHRKCFVDSCIKNNASQCTHIEATQRCFSDSQPLAMKQSVISTLNIPSEQQQTLSTMLNESSDVLVQRVSRTSFVVKCAPTNKHPLGYLHIMFYKVNRDDGTVDKKFLCTCKPIKPVSRENEASEEVEVAARFCIHYHACLIAFASDDNLSNEFLYFLSPMSQDCTPTLLSQLHLVTLPPPPNQIQVGGMDTNHISVEIMQENISLLESIAAADDGTLHNVQSLEGVLSDQIIVANVDDSLSFGEASGLEGLEDGDSQVCQIFANAQNTIHLTTAGYSNAENVHHQALNITGTILSSPTGGKKRKEEGMPEMITIPTSHSIQPLISTNHYDNSQKVIQSKGTFGRSFQGTTMITYTTPVTTTVSSSHSNQISIQLPPPAEPQSIPFTDGFEQWLSGVNERINATMNYHFNGTSDPLTYYISTDYFERLRERITSGVKKKRLPNQSVIIARIDRPPAGTFLKHVWKITNMFHVLQIFHSQIIPLKITQYFIKGGNGIYQEWVTPNNKDRKNQLIKPHVHNTYLKVGKNEANAGEITPFTIEWIPDILPQSKLGELSITFEFGRRTNSRDEFSSRSTEDASKPSH